MKIPAFPSSAALAALGLMFATSFPGSVAQANADLRRQVSTSGSCTRFATPDRGRITMTAEALEPGLQDASRKATQDYERAVAEIKKLGLEHLEIQTSEYTLGEAREWEKNKLVSKGYKARLGIQVSTSDIQKLGQVIAIGAREGLKDIGGMSTYLSPAKRQTEHFACLQAASEDARAKAEKLATSLGARLGEVLTIREGERRDDSPSPTPRSFLMQAKSADAVESAPVPSIQTGNQELSLSVDVVFGLK